MVVIQIYCFWFILKHNYDACLTSDESTNFEFTPTVSE